MTHRRIRRRVFVIPVDASRRKFLVAFGVCFLGIGMSYVTAGQNAPVRYSLAWIPLAFELLGLVWVVCGIVAVVSSFLPTTRDKAGFRCLAVPPTLWALLYLVTGVLATFDQVVASRPFVSMLVFGLIAWAVDVVSGMVDAKLVDHHAAEGWEFLDDEDADFTDDHEDAEEGGNP